MLVLITGFGLSFYLFSLLGNVFIPLGLLIWVIIFTDLVWKDKQKSFIIIVAIGGLFYEMLFLYYFFTNITIVGSMRGSIDAEYRNFVIVFLMLGLIFFVITGLIFAREIFKTKSTEYKMRAKFLFAAFISYFVGASLDGIKPFIFEVSFLDFVYIVNRIILISAAVEFYCGFNLPKWIKNRFS